MRASVLSQDFWTWDLKERLLSIWMPRSLEEGEDEGIILWLLRKNIRSWVRVDFFECLERTRSSVLSGAMFRRQEQSHWEIWLMEAWKLEMVRDRLPQGLRGRLQ
jgi:hypothetical protein